MKLLFVSYWSHDRKLFDLVQRGLWEHAGCVADHINLSDLERHYQVYNAALTWHGHRWASPMRAAPLLLTDALTDYEIRKARLIDGETIRGKQRLRLRLFAAFWADVLRPLVRRYDMVVVWNGFHIPRRAALAMAKAQGVKGCVMENGAFPRTVSIDRKGINYGNSIAGLPPNCFEDLALSDAEQAAVFATPSYQRPISAEVPVEPDAVELPESFIFFPMQVFDDTQLLFYSPNFASMEEAIAYLHREINAYNRRTGRHVALVVKEHPTDIGRRDYTALRARYPDVVFLKTMPTSAIIPRSLAVATINSSVGIDGLLHRKHLITLGQAFYSRLGIAWPVTHAAGCLESILDRIIDTEPDVTRIAKYLYFLQHHYFVPTPSYADSVDEVLPVVERLRILATTDRLY